MFAVERRAPGSGRVVNPWGRVLFAALMILLVQVAPLTPAQGTEKVVWSGGFTGASAANPTPVLTASTAVTFSVSRSLTDPETYGAQIRLYRGEGEYMGVCSYGSSCSLNSNPAPGTSLSYYAQVWVMSGGTWVGSTISPTVTVTDPGWTGSFTEAFAVNSMPVLSESTSVVFKVDAALSSAQIRLFRGVGELLGTCSSGSLCSLNSNPVPGAALSYYAQVWVVRDGSWVHYATSPTVTVTDPGWTGVFTEAYAVNSMPVLSESTSVVFKVDSTLSSAQIRLFRGASEWIGTCTTGSSCPLNSNPAPGTSLSYYAQVWVLRNGSWVDYATSPTVVVTDPGWTGSFTSAEAVGGEYEFLGVTSARFTWDEPLQYAWIDIVDEQGGVVGTCSQTGSLECSAALALGPDESQELHARARVHGVGGGFVTVATSASVELMGMDAEAYANFLLTAPEAALVALLGQARAAQALQLRTAVQSQTFCHSLGIRFSGNALFRSSVPDATLLCMGGTAAALAWMITTVGVDIALDIFEDAADTDVETVPGGPGADPDPGGGGPIEEPDCYFYDFDGHCLDAPVVDPAPELLADADGARIPPPPNCLSDAMRDQLIADSPIQSHHIITRYANQAPPGADDVLLERQENVDALQGIAAQYQLGINAPWNKISIPHRGPHPNAYHNWLRDQAIEIDQVAGGDHVVFLSLWELLVRDVIESDPTIVRHAYWECDDY
jgi:hypothetical protein